MHIYTGAQSYKANLLFDICKYDVLCVNKTRVNLCDGAEGQM